MVKDDLNHSNGYSPPLISGLLLPDGTITQGTRLQRTFRLHNARMACALDLSGKRVLDIGCSVGLHALYMAGSANEVIGIDHNKKAIATANATSDVLGINNVKFIVGDIREQKIFNELGYFDLIVGWGLLHRISDPFLFFDRASRLGDALSLEWETPVIPFMSSLSFAYHSISRKIDSTNINTGEEMYDNWNKVESDAGFWNICPGAVKVMGRRVGFIENEVLGYGENFKNGIITNFRLWKSHIYRKIKRMAKSHGSIPQVPLARVHMVLQKKKDLIKYKVPLTENVELPLWDKALQEKLRTLHN